jgi:hypothetical protein
VEGFPSESRDSIPARVAFFLAYAQAGEADAAAAALSPEVEGAARTTDMFSRFLVTDSAGWGTPTKRSTGCASQ